MTNDQALIHVYRAAAVSANTRRKTKVSESANAAETKARQYKLGSLANLI